MSQSQTSWTRLFHSPLGFIQDVPHSDLLSSWLLASKRHLSLTRRNQRKDGCEGLQKHLLPATYPAIHAKQQFLQLTRKKIWKPIRNVPLSLYMPYGLEEEIIHLPFDSVNVKALLRKWPLFLRKGGESWAIFFWAKNNFLGSGCAGIFFLVVIAQPSPQKIIVHP